MELWLDQLPASLLSSPSSIFHPRQGNDPPSSSLPWRYDGAGGVEINLVLLFLFSIFLPFSTPFFVRVLELKNERERGKRGEW